ncbi:DUF3558 domain-containing protein [Amycolatopsis nigrescens]|uniref:DUF3558 domain-containing protein n=1 Tax=Amycolatopsis nigrescens TaxID=381445 RepID=UPI001FE0AA9E|nr:DUF3558 domain-containing protein [Amycolatopsis nigrescens]
MTRYRTPIVVGLALVGTVLTGCSEGNVGGTPIPETTGTASTPSNSAPANGAPKVKEPLPATVLNGAPCDTALTAADVNEFIGTSAAGQPGENELGPKCYWSDAQGSGAGFTVFYQIKAKGGLGPAYQNVKPRAARWEELAAIQGYPAVGYLPAGAEGSRASGCQVVVGISDDLAFSVAMTLGDGARNKGVDPCTAGRDVADRVLTNIKGRA